LNHVFAKVKALRKKPFFKLLSDYTLYENIDISINSCVPYNPDHNLDEDSWFKIENFSQKDFCLDFLKNNFDSKDCADLKKDQFEKISYIFSLQGDDFYFQKVSPALFISKKTIAFGEVAKIEESENRLVINEYPDAIYYKKLDVLVFRNLAVIASIFKGIDILFKEATNAEVSEFLSEPFLILGNEYSVASVSTPNRKRIALAMETLRKMSAQDKGSMLGYINDYCDGKLAFDAAKGNFEVSKDEDLKYLLYGIEQRFYTTPFGKEKRLANSVLALA